MKAPTPPAARVINPVMNSSLEKGSDFRLMVLAPNWLGDVVMHTPLLSYLDKYRSAVAERMGRPVRVHLGVRSVWAGLFQGDRRIDELVPLRRDSKHRGVGGTFRLASLLRRGPYDAVILGPPSLRTGLAAWMARIPTRVGYRTDGRSAFLTVGLDPLTRGRQHYSREMISLGAAWLESMGLPLPELDPKEWPTSLPGLSSLPPAEVNDDSSVWAVAPGTTFGEAKTWPMTRLGDFLALAIEKENVRIVLLGDDSARGFTSGLRDRFKNYWSAEPGDGAPVVDLTGKTDLPAVARLLKASAAFIGNDSGLMHLAAALDCPTVGIFGSSNPDWTAPVGRHTRAIHPEGFACRPCYRKTCNQPEFCLDSVSGEAVLTAVKDLIGGVQLAEEGA